MFAGTSTVSTAIRPRMVPSRTFDSSVSLPTVFSNVQLLQPRADPSAPGCCPNKVVINLSTALVIPDYSLYYDTPIESFQPQFYALNDGSLVAPPLFQDLAGANVSLLVTGMLAMLFVRNMLVSGDYIRRGKVKKKTLFYVLFLSQILAPISLVPVILSYFNEFLNCTVVIILSCVSGTVSLALLITGILGVKAYKCLNNSRFVLIVLGMFQCASSGIVAMDVATMRGERRLSGSCIRISDLLCTRIFVLIQLFESLFICCCFMYACWKSRGSSAARGRISIQLSMEELPIEVPNDATEKHPTLRGWWDYVPNTDVVQPSQPPSEPKQDHTSNTVQSTLACLLGLSVKKKRPPPSRGPTGDQKPTAHSERGQTTHIIERPHIHGRTSPTPSSFSRLSKFVPHMELFQKVMKDELLYTTFITATCVVVAVLAVIGVNFKNGLTVTGWIALNWSVISLLAIHSFGRVVRRHERDALLQRPSTCTVISRAGNVPSSVRHDKPRKSRLSSSIPSQLRFRREMDDNDINDPFSDTQRLGDFRESWHTTGVISFTSDSPPPSPSPQISELSQIPIIPPSPSVYSTFPTSGRGTPLVPHQSLDGVQGFSQSWLFDRGSFSTSGDGKSEENIP